MLTTLSQQSNDYSLLLWVVNIAQHRTFSFFFSLLFRPQIRRRKRHEKNAPLGNVFVSELTNTGHGGSANTATPQSRSANTDEQEQYNTQTDPSHHDPSRFNFNAPITSLPLARARGVLVRRPLATCYNQRATAVILTAMHLQTPNCLPDRLIISQIATYDANMQRYASSHHEVQIIRCSWHRVT